jgi:hypothetical protein
VLDIVARDIRWLICPQTQHFGQLPERKGSDNPARYNKVDILEDTYVLPESRG